MDIYIDRLNEQDAKELFAFECKNRRFFEQTVQSRGDDYYSFGSFEIRHRELLKEQDDAMSSFYLIKEDSGTIVGRINLVDIDRIKGTAQVGYRIGEAFTKKGVANKALQLLVKLAPDMNVTQIHAKTTTVNIGSQKVLVKNGFERISVREDTSEKLPLYHYRKNL
ncbi:GNAT family N-acetyltransferase [Peribacillus muralis]|uniref:GNAT family N-acetyltransferase n=1 Tax=Peribacillus muralis TaxID=264697 RepID=UPI001F4E8595|nr:GNAT family N-acetyltransferase [Peribacillus muralis]MCK1992052.1 GNAT family N-acetyltransferase [Peribacillus muralis]MCK2012608.1 GNAT family N-acetyltransferase [Peribacillus muralis]